MTQEESQIIKLLGDILKAINNQQPMSAVDPLLVPQGAIRSPHLIGLITGMELLKDDDPESYTDFELASIILREFVKRKFPPALEQLKVLRDQWRASDCEDDATGLMNQFQEIMDKHVGN